MRFSLLIFLCFSALWLPKGWKWTRGPTPRHFVRENSGFCQEPLDAISSEVLNQPFVSWGRGSQCEVFLSRDGKWVLKVPRNKKTRPHLLGRFRNRSKLESCLNSFRVAGSQLLQETAVGYVHHGDPISMPEEFMLSDRLGRKMKVDVGALPFVLQRRINLFSEVLQKASGIEEEKHLLLTLLDLIVAEREKGWVCTDYAFSLNLGYERGCAFRVDIGSYLPAEGRFDWDKITKPIRHYLREKKGCTLCSWWDEEIQKHL